MGRELRRKQAKREGKNVREAQKNSKGKEMEPKTFYTLIIILVIFFVALYIVTGVFVTKDIKWFDKSNNNNSTTEVVSNKILAKDTLRQKEEEYYVYYYDSKNVDQTVENIVNKLTTVYKVDLADDFNSNFKGSTSGLVSNIDDLKVESPTVIKVESGSMTEIYSGSESITSLAN